MNFILITIYTNKTTYLKLSKDSIFNSNFNTNVTNKNFKSIYSEIIIKTDFKYHRHYYYFY